MSMLRRGHVDVDMVVRTRRKTMEQGEPMSVHQPMRREKERQAERERGGGEKTEVEGGIEEGREGEGKDRKRDRERKTVESCARV